MGPVGPSRFLIRSGVAARVEAGTDDPSRHHGHDRQTEGDPVESVFVGDPEPGEEAQAGCGEHHRQYGSPGGRGGTGVRGRAFETAEGRQERQGGEPGGQVPEGPGRPPQRGGRDRAQPETSQAGRQ